MGLWGYLTAAFLYLKAVMWKTGTDSSAASFVIGRGKMVSK